MSHISSNIQFCKMLNMWGNESTICPSQYLQGSSCEAEIYVWRESRYENLSPQQHATQLHQLLPTIDLHQTLSSLQVTWLVSFDVRPIPRLKSWQEVHFLHVMCHLQAGKYQKHSMGALQWPVDVCFLIPPDEQNTH